MSSNLYNNIVNSKEKHIIGLDSAYKLCEEKSDILESFLDKIRTEVRSDLWKFQGILRKNELIEKKMIINAGELLSLSYIIDSNLESVQHNIYECKEKLNNNKEKILKIKSHAEKYYEINMIKSMVVGSIYKLKDKHRENIETIEDENQEKQGFNKLTHKFNLFYPESILSGNLAPDSKEGQNAIKEHEKKRRDNLLLIKISSGLAKGIIVLTLTNLFGPAYPILKLWFAGLIMFKYNKFVQNEKATFFDGNIIEMLKFSYYGKWSLFFLLIDYYTVRKYYSKKQEVNYNTSKKNIYQLEKSGINVNEIFKKYKKLKIKYTYKIVIKSENSFKSDSILLLFETKEIKSKKGYITKMMEAISYNKRGVIKKKFKFTWKEIHKSVNKFNIRFLENISTEVFLLFSSILLENFNNKIHIFEGNFSIFTKYIISQIFSCVRKKFISNLIVDLSKKEKVKDELYYYLDKVMTMEFIPLIPKVTRHYLSDQTSIRYNELLDVFIIENHSNKKTRLTISYLTKFLKTYITGYGGRYLK